MEHVVFFPAHDGTPAFRRVASLEDAVRLVEHLRNVEGVSEVSCHALTEVPLAFRAWYRVEVPAGEPGQQPAPEPEPVGVAVSPAREEVSSVEADPVATEGGPLLVAVSNGHSQEAAKSLGFFA